MHTTYAHRHTRYGIEIKESRQTQFKSHQINTKLEWVYYIFTQDKKKCSFWDDQNTPTWKERNESQQTPIQIEKKIHNSYVFRIFARKVNHTNKHLHQTCRKLSTQTKPSSNSIVLSQSRYGFSTIHTNQQQIKQKSKKRNVLGSN